MHPMCSSCSRSLTRFECEKWTFWILYQAIYIWRMLFNPLLSYHRCYSQIVSAISGHTHFCFHLLGFFCSWLITIFSRLQLFCTHFPKEKQVSCSKRPLWKKARILPQCFLLLSWHHFCLTRCCHCILMSITQGIKVAVMAAWALRG